MRFDYGDAFYGDSPNKRRFVYHQYGDEIEEFKGKQRISKPVFTRVYNKYQKQGKAGIGYRRFYGD
jgi:hypothetical protein